MNRQLVVFVQPSEERIELCISKGIVPDAPAEPVLLFCFFSLFLQENGNAVNITINNPPVFQGLEPGFHFLSWAPVSSYN